MAFTPIGVTLADVIGPLQSYSPGTRTTTPAVIPVGISGSVILVDLRNVTTLTLVLSWSIEHSTDGGATWVSVGGAGIDLTKAGYTNPGGVLTNPEGGPVRISGSTRLLPRTDLSRLLRVRFTNNETATVSVTLAVW